MKVLLELTVEAPGASDGLFVPSHRLVEALEALSRHGVRVTGVEPSEGGPVAIVVAEQLRLALGANAIPSPLPSVLLHQVEAMIPERDTAAHWLSEWLRQPVPALGGKRPSELLGSSEGLAHVSDLLSRMQSGAYS